MDSQNERSYPDAAFIGRTLMEEAFPLRLEAFSGNALYCRRGMPTMNRYKTVKEVCALTGLTRKHLYYFHHEKVVQAVAYSNYSVEGNDGYKLYDDAAVEKLQQISLYYQLGLKRDEIRDIMLDPNYDSNQILETLLALELRKREQANRHIAALEYLKMTGVKNSLIGMISGISLEVLGQTLLAVQADAEESLPGMDEGMAEKFSGLLAELKCLDETPLAERQYGQIIDKMFALGKQHMGSIGCAFVLGLLVCAAGEGAVARELGENIPAEQGEAVLRYLVQHPELYKNSTRNQECEGAKNNRRNRK